MLFWLSLLPFATGFMEESGFQPVPVAIYGFDLLMCAIAYTLLVISLLAEHGRNSDFARALGSDRKGKISMLAYILSIPLAFVNVWVSLALILGVALTWVVPDRRFARPA